MVERGEREKDGKTEEGSEGEGVEGKGRGIDGADEGKGEMLTC